MKNFLFLLLLLVLVGCKHDSSDEVKSNPSGIAGLWKTSCLQSSETLYYKFVADISEENLYSYAELYNDSSCVLNHSNSSFITGIYTLGESMLTEGGYSADELDLLIVDSEGLVLQIVAINGNKLYFGVLKDDGSRPTALNFDRVYYFVE